MLFECATFKNILMCNYVYKTTLICVSASFKNKSDLYYPYEENLWQKKKRYVYVVGKRADQR